MERNIQLKNAKLVANVSLALLLITYVISIASVFTYIYTHDITIKYNLFSCLLGLIALSIIHNKALSKVTQLQSEIKARQEEIKGFDVPDNILAATLAIHAKSFLTDVVDSDQEMVFFGIDIKKHTAIMNVVYVFKDGKRMDRAMKSLNLIHRAENHSSLFSNIDVNFDIYSPSTDIVNYGDITCRFKFSESLISKAKENMLKRAIELHTKQR